MAQPVPSTPGRQTSPSGTPSPRLNRSISQHSNHSQQSLTRPSSHPRLQSRNVGTPAAPNQQLLRPPSPNLAGSITNTTGSSVTLNTNNVPNPASAPILPTSHSHTPTPPASAAPAYPKVPLYTFIENTFRAWSLASLYELGVKISNKIMTKQRRLLKKGDYITLYQSRSMALWTSLLHLLPVAGTAMITYYINTEYFVGKELPGLGADKSKLLGLQFAAKVHELLMISTLTSIIFTMVRHELCGGNGVSIAALTAGHSVPRVSFLWSKDFVALCNAKYDKLYKKVIFLAATALCVLLSVAVAPASATALTPVKKEWEAGGTSIWLNSTKSQLFPRFLNDTHTLGEICSLSGSHAQCPSAQWQSISEGYLPQFNHLLAATIDPPEGAKPIDQYAAIVANVVDTSSEFTLLNRESGIRFNVIKGFSFTRGAPTVSRSAVTAQHIAVSDGLLYNYRMWTIETTEGVANQKLTGKRKMFSSRSSSSYRAVVPSPIAMTTCWELHHSGSENERFFYKFLSGNFSKVNVTELQQWESAVANSSRPELLWLDTMFTETSIMPVISIPTDYKNKTTPYIFACPLEARWMRHTLIGVSGQEIARPLNDSWYHNGHWLEGKVDDRFSPVTINRTFAQYANPRLPYSNSTVFEEMLVAAGVWNQNTSRSSRPPNAIIVAAETVLNLMMVNAMARTAPYTRSIGVPETKHYLPRGTFGPGGDVFWLTDEEKANSYSFRISIFAEGYGYSFSRSTASRVSILILLVHLAIAVSFIIWSIASGTSSSSWDSPAELVALALASDAPSDRAHLATGEGPIKVLKKRYCIEVQGNRIELKEWTGPNKVEESKRVKPNVAYE